MRECLIPTEKRPISLISLKNDFTMDFLFDIGRVLLDFDFESSMRRLTRNKTIDSYERLIQSVNARNPFESGEITASEFIKQSIESCDTSISSDDFIAAWRHVFTRNPPMWETVAQLKAEGNHRLILFSNTNAIHCPWIFEEFPEFEAFDGKVLSYQVGVMKPDAKFYHHAIRKFTLDPAHTLYIDDLPENIATGERFGFRCHLYRMDQHNVFEAWLAQELEKD
jgi:putative hydrolase of the HAD superfamily